MYLLGTDINQDMINRAIIGEYSRWSFRDEPVVPIGQYFSLTDNNKMRINENIRDMVTFKRFNLIPDSYLSGLVVPGFQDLILCRNVLMYFRAEQSARVVDYLTRSLNTDGNLIVSPQEIGIVSNPELSLIRIGPLFIYTKKLAHNGISLKHDLLQSKKNNTGKTSNLYSDIFQNNKNQITISEPLDFLDLDIVTDDPGEINLSYISVGNNKKISTLSPLDSGKADTSDNISTMEDLIISYAGKGDYENASGWCDRMIAKDPLYPRSYLLKSAILEEQDLYPDAILSLRQALFADPDYLPAHLSLAGIFRKTGKDQEAYHHYEQSLMILNSMNEMEVLEESDGISALKMKELIQSIMGTISCDY